MINKEGREWGPNPWIIGAAEEEMRTNEVEGMIKL